MTTRDPWTVESDGITLAMAGQIVATAIAPDGARIDEQRANARLIAAAPELLNSLSYMVSQIRHFRGQGNKQMDSAISAAIAAIDKATS